MPTQARSLRRVAAAAAMAGALALGAMFAFPGVGQAQTDETTTTVVEETTETTIAREETPAEGTKDESTNETRPQRSDPDCDHAEDTTSET